MKIQGFLMQFAFYYLWVGATLLTPTFIILAVFFQYYKLGMLLISYFIFRFFFPTKTWPWLKNSYIKWFKKYEYFKKWEIIFHPEIKKPQPNGKALFTFNPHGVMATGAV